MRCWFCIQTRLDTIGCELNCSTMTDHTQDHKFVIARSEVGQHTAMHTVPNIFSTDVSSTFSLERGPYLSNRSQSICFVRVGRENDW